MAINTRLTARLGVPHPVLLAPMDLVADGTLAATVSRAGGLGLIGGGYGDETWLKRQFDAAGETRVGVGFITWSLARNPRCLDLVLERKPVAVMLTFGDAAPHADVIKRNGALLICGVQSVDQAREALACGADIIVTQGADGGGHACSRGTFTLVPEVADLCGEVPVVAAGGVADGRGLAAALMLGASGVLMGTRFYATRESAGHPDAKARIVAAAGDGTIRSILFDIARRNVWPAPYSGRVLRNRFSQEWEGRETALLQRPQESERYRQARDQGDFDVAAVIAGEGVGLVHDIASAAEVVRQVVEEAERRLATFAF
jgi:nitronate monooxygenase